MSQSTCIGSLSLEELEATVSEDNQKKENDNEWQEAVDVDHIDLEEMSYSLVSALG